MNIIFKRKSRSLPHFRKKIYSKIGTNCQQEQWKIFLKNENELTSIMHQLSKAQFDIRSQDKFKYTARSILMMKREIIKFIEKNDLVKAKGKLKELHEKVNYGEMKKIGMIIIFLEYREELEKGIGSGQEDTAISWLKERLAEHLNGTQISAIKVKIMTILSILLLRFRGILMSSEEKLIIFKTIELKKKKMLQMDVREQRQAQFQCLLYLLLELYKILYLLKKDQQTIHCYYNQLNAYTQVYLTRQENRLYLDINQINSILTNMKPVLNDIDIYEDSKLRKELAFSHIQQEIIHQENQSTKVLQIQKAQEKNRIQSSIKIPTLKQQRRSSFRVDQKLVINHFTNNIKNQEIYKEETIQDVLVIEKTPVCFSFLVVSQERLYIADLIFKFRNSCSLIDVCLVIRNQALLLQRYELRGLELVVSKLTFKAISRFMQKVCQMLFQSNCYFKQLHNIYFANSFLPAGLDFQHMAVALARIKTQVGQYLKQNYCKSSLIGFKFNVPELTLEEIRGCLHKQGKISSAKPENLIQKRNGFILKENYKMRKISQLCIRILMIKQNQKNNQFFFFNIFFDSYFKGVEVYYLNEKDDIIDLTEYINKFKRMSAKLVSEKRSVQRQKVMAQVQGMITKTQRVNRGKIAFKIQQQLQINQQKLKPQTIPVKYLKKFRENHNPQKAKIFQIVKLDRNQYYLFVKEVCKQFIIYKNEKVKLCLPLNWKQSGWTLVKNRLRVYSGIKIVQSSDNYVQADKGGQGLIVNIQRVVVNFQRHKIVRKRSGYSMVLEYRTHRQQYLYELVVSKQQRYYFLHPHPIQQWTTITSFDEIALKYCLKSYQGTKQKISEANWYYLNHLD